MNSTIPISRIHTYATLLPIASSLRPSSILTRQFSRRRPSTVNHTPYKHLIPQSRNLSNSPRSKMSQKPFSNTEVPGDKPADPYTATNKSEPELKEKVQDLVSFIESCKFGMMTTRIGSSGLLTSRCMALAAKVSSQNIPHTSAAPLHQMLMLLFVIGRRWC